MATSSSEESNSAPTDFNLSSFTGSNNGKASVIYEKCPLCLRSRKTFYCRECIANGDITHSKAKYPERLAEKKLKLFRLMKDKAKYLENCQELFERKRRLDSVQTEINHYTQRTKLLKLAIDYTSAKLSEEKEELQQLNEKIETHSDRKTRYAYKLQKMLRHINQYKRSMQEQKELLYVTQNQLKEVVKENVQQLFTYIFPINEVVPAQSDDYTESAVTELVEAQQTNYIKGHWVWTDNCREVQYSIVEPCLPGSGNYAAYPVWVTEHKDSMTPTVSDNEQRNPAFNIIAALTHTTQLISVLAFYLDVRLPKNLNYSEFCGHELTEAQFMRKVAKLNSNVLHLCLSQNVTPVLLQPRQTILNLLLLLNIEASDLGRCGPIEVNLSLMESMEESLLKDLNAVDDTDDSKNSDEESEFVTEWETVSEVDTSEFIPPSSMISYTGQTGVYSQMQPTATTSLAGGLMSAAASVASLWRAATGQK